MTTARTEARRIARAPGWPDILRAVLERASRARWAHRLVTDRRTREELKHRAQHGLGATRVIAEALLALEPLTEGRDTAQNAADFVMGTCFRLLKGSRLIPIVDRHNSKALNNLLVIWLLEAERQQQAHTPPEGKEPAP